MSDEIKFNDPEQRKEALKYVRSVVNKYPNLRKDITDINYTIRGWRLTYSDGQTRNIRRSIIDDKNQFILKKQLLKKTNND